MSAGKGASVPPDQEARDRILRDLDVTMIVEAAAGTGKTTCLVGRMTALVAAGRCGIEQLAAVTFTRKAAAELRGRFTAALREGARGGKGEEGRRLAEAAGRAERCFIGTIHSFCARLLRERPVEAGVDVAFTEIDDEADALLRAEAWREFTGSLFTAGEADGRLDDLAVLGLEVGQLEEAFMAFARYPDVEEWPCPPAATASTDGLRRALGDYVRRIRPLLPFPDDKGTDRLMARLEQIERRARHLDLTGDAALMEAVELFEPKHGAVQKCWPGGPKQAKSEIERWDAFRDGFALPALRQWRQRRYGLVLSLLRSAVGVYDRLRSGRGLLNFQDLLLRAALLLRENQAVRRYFRRRFTHLLVDEFQDTDPLQAEVMLTLTADDPAERDWRRCRPVPGSLFVVGDPKQSIYRFRRADIVTYQEVRRIIEGAGGAIESLEANFRTVPGLIGWVNGIFDSEFPAAADRHSPAAHSLLPGRGADGGGALPLRVITVPAAASGGSAPAAHDAALIARRIRAAVDRGEASPGDFLVIAWRKRHLHLYAAALQELGIPHRVTGGSAWRQVEELGLLARCLRAVVEPENPVALVAALRGGLFGIDDAELYAFRRAGGRFAFSATVPPGLAPETADRIGGAFAALRRAAGFFRLLPPVAALERTSAELGLHLRALSAPGGDGRAGTMGKAFALLREAQREHPSLAGLADRLDELIEEEREFDGMPARAAGEDLVRVMNLHKAKGLEAREVFLADPGGKDRSRPALHVDRSGGRAVGYLAVTERTGDYRTRVLAHPAGWEELQAEEESFARAERLRLFYVAATRAGGALTVTRRVKGSQHNPWSFFGDHLGEALELEDPGPQRPPTRGTAEVTPGDAAAAGGAVASRWEAALGATWEVRGAKEVAVSAAELHRRAGAEGEHGTEWGTVIHFLLETALREPGRGLEALARSALEEQGLSPSRAAEALSVVAAVTESETWRRAAASPLALVEVPFQIALGPGDPIAGEKTSLPTVVRGVVDLAFRERGGWVLVDWKTDTAGGGLLEPLAERYRPQIELYAALWERITGEKVAERGLYFTGPGRYVIL